MDQIKDVPSFVTEYENRYKSFITELRTKYTDAEIFALKGVSIPYNNVNEAARKAVTEIAATDSKVHYVDTSSWGVQISGDGIHPTMEGYNTMSAKLVEILAPYVVSGKETITPSSIPGRV